MKALKSLALNRDIRILKANKCNCIVVLNESRPTYKEKLAALLQSGAYESTLKDPTSRLERKMQKLLSGRKLAFYTELKRKLTPIIINRHTRGLQ
jgi:hypothetical protein